MQYVIALIHWSKGENGKDKYWLLVMSEGKSIYECDIYAHSYKEADAKANSLCEIEGFI